MVDVLIQFLRKVTNLSLVLEKHGYALDLLIIIEKLKVWNLTGHNK